MNIDKLVMLILGVAIFIGTCLGYHVDPYWLILPAVLALHMIQMAFTNFCLAAKIMKKLGIKPGSIFK